MSHGGEDSENAKKAHPRTLPVISQDSSDGATPRANCRAAIPGRHIVRWAPKFDALQLERVELTTPRDDSAPKFYLAIRNPRFEILR